jgi:hypothetical protein
LACQFSLEKKRYSDNFNSNFLKGKKNRISAVITAVNFLFNLCFIKALQIQIRLDSTVQVGELDNITGSEVLKGEVPEVICVLG